MYSRWIFTLSLDFSLSSHQSGNNQIWLCSLCLRFNQLFRAHVFGRISIETSVDSPAQAETDNRLRLPRGISFYRIFQAIIWFCVWLFSRCTSCTQSFRISNFARSICFYWITRRYMVCSRAMLFFPFLCSFTRNFILLYLNFIFISFAFSMRFSLRYYIEYNFTFLRAHSNGTFFEGFWLVRLTTHAHLWFATSTGALYYLSKRRSHIFLD